MADLVLFDNTALVGLWICCEIWGSCGFL